MADFEGVCSGDIYVLESRDSATLQPELLPFLCQTDDFFEHAVGTSAGSLSPRTNWTRLAEYEFALPPLEEQERLVDVLAGCESLRGALSEALVAATRAAEALLEEQVARLANGLPLTPVTRVLSRLTVGIVVKPADLYTDDEHGVPALRSLNVRPGELVMTDLVKVTRDGHEAHLKSALSGGDVVIVRTGRPGDAAAVPDGLGPLNCIDLIVTTPREALRPQYFAALLNSSIGRRAFSAGAAGTAQQHFNVGAFKRVSIPVPPLEVQDALVEEHGLMAAVVPRLRQRIADASRLRRSMLAELLA